MFLLKTIGSYIFQYIFTKTGVSSNQEEKKMFERKPDVWLLQISKATSIEL